jgi:hypothetical protein
LRTGADAAAPATTRAASAAQPAAAAATAGCAVTANGAITVEADIIQSDDGDRGLVRVDFVEEVGQ